ncbi:hypothetical protein EB796_005692 [Bugula neritina]|uniref:Uncharacterized protein n=1 Tax=Bugula neritina TaxID=10212 RepID=A0A7J7KEV3_BUGNE|nr:hypothetical protein EB796_005692 [Bugula neritina]
MGSTSSVEADVKIEKEIQPSASSMTHNSDDVEVGDSQNKKAEDTDVVENAADTNDANGSSTTEDSSTRPLFSSEDSFSLRSTTAVTNSGSKQEEPEAAVTAARPEPVHNTSNPAKLSNNYRLPDIGKAPVIDSKPIGKLEHLPDPPVPDNDEGLRCLSQNEIEDLILKQHQHQLAPKHQSISVKSLDSRQNNVYNSETERQAKVLDRDPNEWNIQVNKNIDGFDMEKFKAANKKTGSGATMTEKYNQQYSGDLSALVNTYRYTIDDEKLMSNIERSAC